MIKDFDIFEPHEVHGRYCYCLMTGMDPHTFAHSMVITAFQDAGVRIFPDNTVQYFSLNETVTVPNPKGGKEQIAIVLPVQDAQPLIRSIALESQRAHRGDSSLRLLYRLFYRLVAAYKTGAVSEAFLRTAAAAPLCLLTDTAGQDLIILPPQPVLRCVTANAEAALHWYYPWVHPDGTQAPLSDAVGFFLAALSYACITGSPPFDASMLPFSGRGRLKPIESMFAESTGVKKTDGLIDVGTAFSAKPSASGMRDFLVQNMRDGVYIPVELYCPALTASFSSLINRCLTVCPQARSMHSTAGADEHSDAAPLFEQLCNYKDESLPLVSYSTETTVYNVPSAAEVQAAIDNYAKKAGSKIRRRRFLARYRAQIALGVFGCVLLIAAVTGIIGQLNKTPETAGLSAQAVVQGFYTAAASLDQVKMGAYTKEKAGAAYEELVMHFFVTGKIRETYEQKKIYYSPEEFLQICSTVRAGGGFLPEHRSEGKKDTQPLAERNKLEKTDAGTFKRAVIAALNGGAVYGISQLAIEYAGETEWFDASFYYWTPIFTSEKTEELMNNFPDTAERDFFPVQVFRCRDRVRVTEERGCFFVASIESLERTPVAESSDEILQACLLPQKLQPEYLQSSAAH